MPIPPLLLPQILYPPHIHLSGEKSASGVNFPTPTEMVADAPLSNREQPSLEAPQMHIVIDLLQNHPSAFLGDVLGIGLPKSPGSGVGEEHWAIKLIKCLPCILILSVFQTYKQS
jgi:hypothetical protein